MALCVKDRRCAQITVFVLSASIESNTSRHRCANSIPPLGYLHVIYITKPNVRPYINLLYWMHFAKVLYTHYCKGNSHISLPYGKDNHFEFSVEFTLPILTTRICDGFKQPIIVGMLFMSMYILPSWIWIGFFETLLPILWFYKKANYVHWNKPNSWTKRYLYNQLSWTIQWVCHLLNSWC